MTHTILRIDASVRREGSVSRDLATRIIDKLGEATVIHRDLAGGLPLIDEAWVNANFTAAEDRTDAQREKLRLSDSLVAEIQAADSCRL